MTMRELTDEEKEFMNKQMNRIEEETKDAEYLIKYCNLMLEEGISINVAREIRKFEAQKREAENAIEVNKNTVIAMKEQIEKGVEVKESDEEEVLDEDAE